MRLFIVRASGPPSDLDIRRVRRTPDWLRTADDQRDYFCLGDDLEPERLTGSGWTVVPLKDGWYPDDAGGGIGVWGGGRYFEVRDSLFTSLDDAQDDLAVQRADDLVHGGRGPDAEEG
jgi:hypothetical protein